MYKFNIFTGTLDLVGNSSSGGGVQGPPSSTDKAITRWNGTTGNIIEDSLTLLQDGGAIEAAGFITGRTVTTLVSIPSGKSMIAPSLELELTGSIELEPDGELIIV